jgi:VWA domain containing CoxE-like protein
MSLSAHRVADGGLVCCIPDTLFEKCSSAADAAADTGDLVFLIDSSGSMQGVWANVAAGVNAILESRPNTHILKWANIGRVRKEKLQEDQDACERVDSRHGGSVGWGTNITAAAEILRSFLSELVGHGRKRVTVVFISDGDGDIDNLEEVCMSIRERTDAAGIVVEMTTLGIGAGFPTHIAMSIRNRLHSGRESVPLLSVVAENSDFQEALNGLSEFTASRSLELELVCPEAVRVAPWAEASNKLHAGVCVMLPEDTSSVQVRRDAGDSKEEGQVSLALDVTITPWTEGELCLFAKQLTWQLQVMSLQRVVHPDEVKLRAGAAFRIVSLAADEIASADYARIESEEKTAGLTKKKSVFDRVARKQLTKSRYIMEALRKELRMLAEGSPLDTLSGEDLKQRLAIGTMEGKFHERAMAFKGLSGDDFADRARAFAALLRDEEKLAPATCLADVEEAAGLRSAFSLETNTDIWAQPQLADAIENCQTQYALVECLPLVGLAVNVRRSSASMINPWAASIAHMSQLTPVLDSLSLISMDGGAAAVEGDGLRASLNTGDDEMETVNAICSVVCSKEHAVAARPFLTSRLYQVLHTHNACGNVDTVDAASHPALLSAVVCYILDQNYAGLAKESTWRRTALLSLRTLYPGLGAGNSRGFVAALNEDSRLAVVTEIPGKLTKCQSMSKPVALCLAWKDMIPEESRPRIFADIAKEWVGRAVGHRRGIEDWFFLTDVRTRFANAETGEEITETRIVERLDIKTYYTTVDALKALPGCVEAMRVDVEFASLVFDEDDNLKLVCRDGAVSFQTLVQFGRMFLGLPAADDSAVIPVSDLKRYIIHATRHASSSARSEAEVVATWKDSLALKPLLSDVKRLAVDTFRESIRAGVKAAWHSEMLARHRRGTTHPLSLAEIARAREARGLPPATAAELGYRADVGLCSHACMCSECPYFLEVHHGKAALHYSEAFESVLTAFSIAVSSCVSAGETDPQVILQAVKSGKYMKYEDEQRRAGLVMALSSPKRWAEELETVKSLIPVYRKLNAVNR